MTDERCPATLEHNHGVSRCELKPSEHDVVSDPYDAREPGQHAGICWACVEDDDYWDRLHWDDSTNGVTRWG